MNPFVRARIFAHVVRWRLSWGKTYTDYAFALPENPKFIGARDAAALIPDGTVVATTGIAGNMRCSVLFHAIRERFAATGQPRDLTLVVASGHGGRGKIPGTVEELGQRGLVTRLFTGHTETYKAFLRLAGAGALELQVLPQGTFDLLLEAMANGEEDFVNAIGAGTFIDPRCGRGTPLVPPDAPQYVSVDDDGRFRWRCPKIDIALFNLPAADRKGNLYARGAATLCEAREIARIARRNGGKAIANVGLLVDEGYGDVFLRADEVDHIVLHPETEQSCTIPHRKAWRCLTPESTLAVAEGQARIGYINRLLGVTPRRQPPDFAIARLAAQLFAEHAPPGAHVDIGTGHPEEVSRILAEQGIMPHIEMLNESGAFGGMAAPGIFFGAAVNPREIVTAPEAFHRIYARLDAAILGLLQADGDGNVNVSKRGPKALDYVGPGGFIDLTHRARLIIFCGSWMAGGRVALEGGRMRIAERGTPKFVARVDEITFNGAQALQRGQRVFYVTHTGAFELTPRGMTLRCIFPGIDLQRDLLGFAPMPIALPEGPVPFADSATLTGNGFRLAFPHRKTIPA